MSDYTPFGYLDNPYHTWDLNRSGVIRSVPGVGVALYYPAGPGGYFDYAHNGVYEAVLRLGFASGDRRFWSPTDFGPGQLTARHHSKNLLRYEFAASDVDITATFVLVNENALGALVGIPPAGTGSRIGEAACGTHVQAGRRVLVGS